MTNYIDEVAEYVDGGVGRCGATTSGAAVRQQAVESVARSATVGRPALEYVSG